jgi:hypothetical protein
VNSEQHEGLGNLRTSTGEFSFLELQLLGGIAENIFLRQNTIANDPGRFVS